MIARAMSQFVIGIDALLRGRTPARASGRAGSSLIRLLLTTLICGMLYGATMGSLNALGGARSLAIFYSALKVPMLLLASFGLSLPSYFVLNTLLGVRSDFPDVVGALVSGQAGLTVVLASLAPITAFWYASDGDYDRALTFNAAMFAIATLAAQHMLRRSYRTLIASNPRHRTLLRIWLAIYSFVAIQMAWVLRPFVGSPDQPVSFFRREAWGNAYVELLHIVLHAIHV
jgi:hypothetical protein